MIRAGLMGMGAAVLIAAAATPAGAQELSDKSVQVFMEYAWSLVPQQFSKKDGSVIVVDKTKKDQVLIPTDVAREVIRVARISAHAQVCNLSDDQSLNYRSLMKRELDKKKWTDQQMLYINQLHLTVVMLLTGKIRLVEKDGDKEVIVDETKAPAQTCTDEQRQKVKDLITAYVKAGPAIAANVPPAPLPGSLAPPQSEAAAAAAAAAPKQPPAAAPAPETK